MTVFRGPTLVRARALGFDIGSSRLRAFNAGDLPVSHLSSNPDFAVPWTLIDLVGSDLSIDGGDPSLINIHTDGIYQAAGYASTGLPAADLGSLTPFQVSAYSYLNCPLKNFSQAASFIQSAVFWQGGGIVGGSMMMASEPFHFLAGDQINMPVNMQVDGSPLTWALQSCGLAVWRVG